VKKESKFGIHARISSSARFLRGILTGVNMEPKKGFKTIDEYIAAFPKNIQSILQELRQVIKSCAPEAQEAISYQIPTFKLNGNLVHFAAFKNHIGFYPTSSAIRAFKEKLAKYEISKGTVRFPINEPIPFELVKEMVRFRVKENLRKK
jgi:uncharacterized protein YdhG (YjbR/CyaY superfamily)